jgi:hypothetical protein
MAGVHFHDPENDRLRVHALTQHLDETLWDVAQRQGHATAVGGTDGNGLFGSQTLCIRCDIRPPVLPHWEHGWVKSSFKTRQGAPAERCNGNRNVMQHGLDWMEGFFNFSTAGNRRAFGHLSMMDQHTGQPDWGIAASDRRLAQFVRRMALDHPDTILAIYGDHGRDYAGRSQEETHFEMLNPALYLAVPKGHLSAEGRAIAVSNRQRPVTMFDLHTTLRNALAPGLPAVAGTHVGIDILRQRISPDRGCGDAGVPVPKCLFHKETGNGLNISVPSQGALRVLAQGVLDHHVNDHIAGSAAQCQHLSVGAVVTARVDEQQLEFEITTPEGPSLWEISGSAGAAPASFSLKQLSEYRVFEACAPATGGVLPLALCVCVLPPPKAGSELRRAVRFLS